MSVARTWFDGLDPEHRALVLQVIAIRGEPSDAQIEEAPDIIEPSWKLDAIGIPADKQPIVRKLIGELADLLRAGKPSKRRR